MKIGIFGGTFNPLHKGHLESLVQVKNNLKLDKILIFPSNITPLKDVSFEKVSSKHRLNIVKESVKDFNEE
jgi:nicotinate-nucleotide adenylyltransferase